MGSFEDFWNWLGTPRESIPTLDERSAIDVWRDATAVVIEVSTGALHRRAKKSVVKDFNAYPDNSGVRPTNDTRYVFAIISHWAEGAPVVGPKRKRPVRSRKRAEDPDHGAPRSLGCECLCCLSRAFLAELTRQKVPLTGKNYPKKWVVWARWKSQIALGRMGRKVTKLPSAKRSGILPILTDYLNDCRLTTNYQRLWDDTVTDLASLGCTLGEGQKLINLLTKYCYAYYFAEIDRLWMAENDWVARLASQFHAPIDSIVLQAIVNKYPGSAAAGILHAKGFTGGQPGHGASCVEIPWSGLECRRCYDLLQDHCWTAAVAEGFIHPMELEMARLWIKK